MRFTVGGQVDHGLWGAACFDPGSIVSGIGAAVGGISSLVGGSKSADASGAAAQQSKEQQAQTRADLMPYNTAGQSAMNQLQGLNTAGFTAGQPNYLDMAQAAIPGTMTQAQLESTPGYQFQMQQGLQATQNSAAARGLGVSGAALKGAATFATGLANSNYQTQFNNQQQKYTDLMGLNTGEQGNAMNLYNRLSGTASIGENAAAQTGTQGTAASAAVGKDLQSQGNADAAGVLGVGSAATGAANNYLNYNLLQGMTKTGQTGGYGGETGAWDS